MSIVGVRNIGEGRIGRRRTFALMAIGRSIARSSLPFLVTVFASSYAYGADCPSAETARNGFVLERPGVRSIVQPSAEQVVVVANEFVSSIPQTQFLVGGLIEVFRISDKGQFAVLPASDIRDIFPLKDGTKQEISWIRLDAKQNSVRHDSFTLQVRGTESIRLGACQYEVLTVRQVFKTAEGEIVDAWTALYSQELQAVLAKRYDEGTAKEQTIGYETITPLGN